MKRNLIKILVLCFFLISAGKVKASTHWTCDDQAFEYDLSMYFSLQRDGNPVTRWDELEVAAFCGTECRGVANVLEIESFGVKYYYMRVHSNVLTGEKITFKSYDSIKLREEILLDTVDFVNLEQYGFPSSLFVLSLPPIHVSGVSLDKSQLSLYNTQNDTLNVTILPSDASDKTIEWSSSTENVASVSENGIVTALKAGVTNIIAKTRDGNLTDTCSVTVLQNNTPIANAGNDHNVIENSLVVLDGSGSFDADGDKLTYLWEAPAGIILNDYSSVSPTFTAPDVKADTLLIFTLTVNDWLSTSLTDTVLITVKNSLISNKLSLENMNITSGVNKCFNAYDSIIVAGNNTSVEFFSGSSSTLIAGQSIRFLPGFHAHNGSFLDAHITTDGTFCNISSDLYLSSITLASGVVDCFNATDTITVAGDGSTVVFENNSSATLIAGKLIRFLPGFHAQEGSSVDANITTNGTFCDGQTASVVEQPQEKSITEEVSQPGRQMDVVVENQIKIYPNPNNGSFTVQNSFEGDSKLIVISLTGQRVYGPVVFKANVQVQIDGLSKGIYLCRILNQQGVQTRKIEVK